ncbi:hypothetical protein FRZ67_01335 [Panacibacter ginsenosidivorans]|uniref:Uncharacterized protein n=1 Tax=Panacibacter ginsenosidivorans TaxID=1813871 RepID=A0A5B8V5K8_9BACT|nr:hypothetical protein [Panacibacter ginsenosidivorans]QEC66011.1 hypothetical protein FRZ67_01335 [Panacibacter ginsenosidivorans]
MFSLFGKKDKMPAIKIADHVWVSSNAKMNACIDLVKAKTDVIFICWFEETLQQLQSFFGQHAINAEVIMYRQASKVYIHERKIIFAEHYPLSLKEQQLFLSLGLQEAIVYSALDEPLFKYFGGENITVLLTNLGMQENESLEHPMIGRALKNAQKKIAKEIIAEQAARSQQDWFRSNLAH